MVTFDGGAPFLYGKPGFHNGGFIASASGLLPEKRQQIAL